MPLDEVPIVGVDDAEERLIRQELGAFEEAAGDVTVRLRHIAVVDLLRHAGWSDWEGRYDFRRRTVDLLPRTWHLDDASFRRVVRHELCHAIDEQAGDVGEGPPRG